LCTPIGRIITGGLPPRYGSPTWPIPAWRRYHTKTRRTSTPCGSATRSLPFRSSEPISLYAYDLGKRTVSRALPNSGMDIMSAPATFGAIVYEQFGSLHLYDLASAQEHQVPVTITGDFPELRPQFEKNCESCNECRDLSYRRARGVRGAWRNSHCTVGKRQHSQHHEFARGGRSLSSMVADGRSIAYFSDESGEYALHIKDQNGMSATRSIGLGTPPSFFSD